MQRWIVEEEGLARAFSRRFEADATSSRSLDHPKRQKIVKTTVLRCQASSLQSLTIGPFWWRAQR